MFAEYTNLFFSHKNLYDLICLVNCEPNEFSNLCKLNKLSLNINNTNLTLFSAKTKKYINSNIVIDSIVIQQVWKIKFFRCHTKLLPIME